MDYRLDEWATLYENTVAGSHELGAPLIAGVLRDLVSFAISLEAERLENTRIITGSLVGYDHDGIEAIAHVEKLSGEVVIK